MYYVPSIELSFLNLFQSREVLLRTVILGRLVSLLTRELSLETGLLLLVPVAAEFWGWLSDVELPSDLSSLSVRDSIGADSLRLFLLNIKFLFSSTLGFVLKKKAVQINYKFDERAF